MKRFAFALVAAFVLQGALADDAHHLSAALSEGEVRKVDKSAKKITIKHGPLANLDMPPMTMVFQVKDPAMLDQVKAGDKVKFQAEKVGAAYTVTRIEPVGPAN
jgi:Cu/Ag efflux protein CusF